MFTEKALLFMTTLDASHPSYLPIPLSPEDAPAFRSPSMASPPRLPPAVDASLRDLCLGRDLPLPSADVLRVLAARGEASALEIIAKANRAGQIRSLDRYMMHVANRSPVSPVRTVVYHSSASSPVALAATSGRASDHLAALGELEFRKAFLILSYVGKHKLEEFVAVDMIRRLKLVDMMTFEKEVWHAVGRNCVGESDRRSGLDWYSGRSHVYHCHVDSSGSYTFKGPFMQYAKNHLQRVLGDDNVMLVKFEGERLNQDLDVYRKVAKEGIYVGLRKYQFFVFKDGGKEEKKKSPSSSPVRCYFVCTNSLSPIDRACKPITISDARSLFMHVHTVASMAKYMARFSLILSKTIKLAVNLDTVDVIHIDDICCKDEEGQAVCNQNNERMILTDGTGFISEDLALICPLNIFKGQHLAPTDDQVNSDSFGDDLSIISPLKRCPPLLIQCRIFYNGSAIKGTLLVNKTLPPRTIHVRSSMIKVEADPNIHDPHCENSFEIVTTSYQPKKNFLSKTLIALLHYGGVPKDYFLGLASAALNDVQCCHVKKAAALRVALRYGDMGGSLIARMILCGIPLDEPFLNRRLSVLIKEENKGLKTGRIPIEQSYYLMGTTDPTGTLKPNEVCVILDHGHVSGSVLVYRNPGLHFGDIHKLTAVYVKDLENIVGDSKYGIFFPSRGSRSLADEMAGGDFDGDMYWVSYNPQLLQNFQPSKPWVQTFAAVETNISKPFDLPNEELEDKLFKLFLDNRFNPSYTMGVAADSWHSFMDRLLTLPEECEVEKKRLRKKMMQLIDIYYDALDAPKTGRKTTVGKHIIDPLKNIELSLHLDLADVEVVRCFLENSKNAYPIHVIVPEHLKAEMFPHYMEKPSSFISTSVMGTIYDMVGSQTEALPSQVVWKLPCFYSTASSDLQTKWKDLYDQYRCDMKVALDLPDKEAKDAAADEVKLKYKLKLYEAREFEETPRPKRDIFEEALAIYHVVYDYAYRINDVAKCSFAWEVAGRALCELHASMQEKSESIPCLQSVLSEILGNRR